MFALHLLHVVSKGDSCWSASQQAVACTVASVVQLFGCDFLGVIE